MIRSRSPVEKMKKGTPSHRKANDMTANRPTWTIERIERLKSCFKAGLSCSQSAREIGTSRNAVIGKMNRMGLSRPKDVIAGQLERTRAPKPAGTLTPRHWRPRSSSPSILAQHEMLFAAYPGPELDPEQRPVESAHKCSLLELSQAKCRWPISEPGARDFGFCGNAPLDGLPYCLGHARLAYRRPPRQRGSASA